MFYECEAVDPLEIVHFTVAQNPIDVRVLNPSVPLDLKEVIDVMIAKNKQERVKVRSILFLILTHARIRACSFPS